MLKIVALLFATAVVVRCQETPEPTNVETTGTPVVETEAPVVATETPVVETEAPDTSSQCKANCTGWRRYLSCANDGKTYENSCLWNVARCEYRLKGLDLKVLLRGRACRPGQTFKPMPKYCPKCTFADFKPTCSSDGRTHYYGKCSHDFYTCKGAKNLTTVHEGFCKRTRCNTNCYRQSTHLLCGSDGRTYRNLCYLTAYMCYAFKRNVTVSIAHEGRCGRPPLGTLDCSGIACPSYISKVCASNGQDYDNACKFAEAECESANKGERLTMKHHGDCSKQIG